MGKKIFKDNLGNIHFGNSAPEGFKEGQKEDMTEALKDLGERKLWRCNVCNDLRIAESPFETCPTCFTKNAYIRIDFKEFNQLIEIL